MVAVKIDDAGGFIISVWDFLRTGTIAALPFSPYGVSGSFRICILGNHGHGSSDWPWEKHCCYEIVPVGYYYEYLSFQFVHPVLFQYSRGRRRDHVSPEAKEYSTPVHVQCVPHHRRLQNRCLTSIFVVPCVFARFQAPVSHFLITTLQDT